MTNIVDVNVLDGEWKAEKPTIIIDADTARQAISQGVLEEAISDALKALELSGKQVIILEAAA